MVNGNSTITNLQEYLENADIFTNVKAAHSRDKGKVIFEAYGEDMSIQSLKNTHDIKMVFTTYGMSVSKETDANGNTYYKFTCNDSYLINDL